MKHAIRPATQQDCAVIAKLYSISSDGVADYVWTQLAEEGEDILDVGRRRYERTDTDFSYENCTVVELNNTVVGMLSAFPIYVNPDYIEEDPVLAPYSRLEEDNSFYICGVSLFEEHRGLGIGTELMQLAESKAKAGGFKKTSLVVFEQNTGAKHLYDRLGYKEVMRVAIYPHPLIHFDGDALLMVKHLGNDTVPLFQGKNQPGIGDTRSNF